MVRRRGIRGKLTRNRSIALVIAVFAFTIVVIAGTDIGVDLFRAGWFEGANFNVQVFDRIVPLQFASNFALSCTVWTESQLNFIDGSSRPLTSGNIQLDETNFNLSVIDLQTLKEVTTVTGDVLMRCSSPVSLTALVISGGTLDTIVDLTKTDDFKRGSFGKTKTLSRTNVLSSQGIKIDSFSFSSSQFDGAIATSSQDYQVSVTLLNQLDVTLEAVAGGVTSSARTVVLFNSWSNGIGLRITGDGSGTPFPIDDNRVIILLEPRPSQINLDITSSPQIDTVVNLPSYQSFESKPKLEVYIPSTTTGLESGSILYQEGPRGFGEVQSFAGQSFPPTSFLSNLPLSGIQPNLYITVAKSDDRTGTDRAYFQVIGNGQTPTGPIPPSPDPTTDPCNALTGSELQQCEISRGMLLTCNEPTYTKIERSFFDIIASKPGVIIQLQPGSAEINEFTTHVCLAQQSIDIFNQLGGAECSAENFVFVDQTQQCVCQFNGQPDTISQTCEVGDVGSESAQPILLYEIAYGGASDIGSIRGLDPIAFSIQQLSLAAVPPNLNDFFGLARFHVVPVIDISTVSTAFGNPSAPVFLFTWKGELTRVDSEPIDLGILEQCSPPNFFTTDSTGNKVRQTNRDLISPSTDCKSFDMNTVNVVTDGTRLGLNVENDIREKQRLYQIARSDIRPDQIQNVLTEKGVTLNDGDKIKLMLEVEGSFLIGSGDIVRAGAVTPMSWEQEFTWVDALSQTPCQGLSGIAKNKCLGSVDSTDTSTNPCLANETELQCWERNHPVQKDTSGNDCRNVFIAGQIKKVCKGDPSAPSTFGNDPNTNKPNGNPGSSSIVDCPQGSTASECVNIVLEVLEKQLTSLLGLSPQTITTLSNNAVLIIGAVIVIIIFALIIRTVIRRRSGRRF
jgi:hypothetical protein